MDELNSYEVGLHLEIEKLEERVAELEVALEQFVVHYQKGINPLCDDAAIKARTALKGKDDG